MYVKNNRLAATVLTLEERECGFEQFFVAFFYLHIYSNAEERFQSDSSVY